MEKDFDFVNNGYTGDRVIERGFEIYDEWMEKRFSSRKIVSFVERAVIASQEKRTLLSCTEALSCLFSLDFRVNEKYDTFLKCLFFYFSWRRETNALKRLKLSFHIEEGADIRSAIEIELQRLRESLEDKEADDGDDETRGGKRNGKAEEEAVTEEKGKEQAAEEKAEEAAEAEETEEGKEAPEEKTNDSPEQAQTDEQINHESGDKQQDAETSQETPEEVVQDEKEPLKEETTTELKEENNGPDEKSEPSADKKEKAKVYHDAVDSSPIYESAVQNKPTSDKVSFIDEVIMDNMIKGKEDYLTHNPLADVKRDGKETQTQDIVINREAESKSTDKDAYLYDKMVMTEKDAASQNTEKASELKTASEIESKEEQTQNNEKSEPIKQEEEALREPLQLDITEKQENDVRREINNNMSKGSIEAFYHWQAEVMREQLSIASAELGIDAPVEIIGRPEAPKTEQPTSVASRK